MQSQETLETLETLAAKFCRTESEWECWKGRAFKKPAKDMVP